MYEPKLDSFPSVTLIILPDIVEFVASAPMVRDISTDKLSVTPKPLTSSISKNAFGEIAEPLSLFLN